MSSPQIVFQNIMFASPDNPDEKNHPLCPSSPRSGVKAERVTNGLVPEKQIHRLDNSSRGKKEKTIYGTDVDLGNIITEMHQALKNCFHFY